MEGEKIINKSEEQKAYESSKTGNLVPGATYVSPSEYMNATGESPIEMRNAIGGITTPYKKREFTETVRDEKGRFIKGKAPKSPGRTPGSVSIMAKIKEYLYANPDKMAELTQYYLNDRKQRDLLLRMIDGNPKQNVDMGVQDESLAKMTKLFETMFNPKG